MIVERDRSVDVVLGLRALGKPLLDSRNWSRVGRELWPQGDVVPARFSATRQECCPVRAPRMALLRPRSSAVTRRGRRLLVGVFAVAGCSAASTSGALADDTGKNDDTSTGASGGDDTATAPDARAPIETGSDSGGLGTWRPGTGDAGSDAAVDAGATLTTIPASVGPIAIAANEETTVCITMRLPNTTAV